MRTFHVDVIISSSSVQVLAWNQLLNEVDFPSTQVIKSRFMLIVRPSACRFFCTYASLTSVFTIYMIYIPVLITLWFTYLPSKFKGQQPENCNDIHLVNILEDGSKTTLLFGLNLLGIQLIC